MHPLRREIHHLLEFGTQHPDTHDLDPTVLELLGGLQSARAGGRVTIGDQQGNPAIGVAVCQKLTSDIEAGVSVGATAGNHVAPSVSKQRRDAGRELGRGERKLHFGSPRRAVENDGHTNRTGSNGDLVSQILQKARCRVPPGVSVPCPTHGPTLVQNNDHVSRTTSLLVIAQPRITVNALVPRKCTVLAGVHCDVALNVLNELRDSAGAHLLGNRDLTPARLAEVEIIPIRTTGLISASSVQVANQRVVGVQLSGSRSIGHEQGLVGHATNAGSGVSVTVAKQWSDACTPWHGLGDRKSAGSLHDAANVYGQQLLCHHDNHLDSLGC
mmetsp:Transcript_40726/g.97736  ORF Transcript_40726/g.97736 Transcript_40726/m.97736 type:complete len:328 (-) Transcript_40726:1177-2160(-)